MKTTALPDGRPVVRVVVIYDGISSGCHASQTLARLARDLDFEVRLDPTPWRLDLLADPDCGARATADLLAADMVMVATGGNSGLPVETRAWFTDCAHRWVTRPRALVALTDRARQPPPAESGAASLLRRIAAETGSDFFATELRLDGVPA